MVSTPKPGQPGNPGRPKGAKGKKLQYLESHREELLEKLVKLALKGDPTSLRLCIDRLVPRLRAVAVPVQVRSDSDDLADQGRELIKSALAGEITADVLRDLFTALYAQGRLVELVELEARLTSLEKRSDAPPWKSKEQGRGRIRTRRKRRELKI